MTVILLALLKPLFISFLKNIDPFPYNYELSENI